MRAPRVGAHGRVRRRRAVVDVGDGVRPARNGGRRCPAAAASVVREQCALKPCVVNCVPGNLSACSACPTGSACGGESHTQTREVERAAANGGRECRPLVKYSRTAAEHC